jgi:RNA recognition motif-containing protein
MNIYVGNLSDSVTEHDLERTFEKYGEVLSATVIKDRYTGTPKGFGFVEMYERSEAEKAIAGLNGTQLNGQAIVVNEARPKDKQDGKKGKGVK